MQDGHVLRRPLDAAIPLRRERTICDARHPPEDTQRSPPRPTWRARHTGVGPKVEPYEIVMASAQPKPDFVRRSGEGRT
jgi:hypothetical protein